MFGKIGETIGLVKACDDSHDDSRRDRDAPEDDDKDTSSHDTAKHAAADEPVRDAFERADTRETQRRSIFIPAGSPLVHNAPPAPRQRRTSSTVNAIAAFAQHLRKGGVPLGESEAPSRRMLRRAAKRDDDVA